MLKELKNYEVLDLMEAFTKIGQIEFESNKRFSYALILNEESLMPKAKALLAISAPAESYQEYENKRNEIIKKYAETDTDGNIILRDKQFVVFSEDVKEPAVAEIASLDAEYEEVIVKRSSDIADYNNILNETIEVEIQKVSLDDIPDELGTNIYLIKQLKGMIE